MGFRVLDGARIVGDVRIGDGSSVWYNAVLRGDLEPIEIGRCSNIQDNCVVHTSRGYPVRVGDCVSVGHAAVLHGCIVADNVLIGMNSTILNGAVIGENSIVGAGAVITSGKEFPPGSLIIGTPARAVRELSDEEIESIRDNARRYALLARE
ncbi:gamma carbonic anhydrase family protein [Methanothermobacter thermautotrophicus]|uniref:Ferripyochelin binding protein n=1 Tax=Methanothermobacter thermautotrophicus (strain ATCC 29096 / DSM 1053 / JCM 10044 / NBRC 100330 / Delta H) TaxID=187420 RepID=O27625_METTH|nr:gamma carbonic anhydrase family protein [Methanothermobacter thermautotrophicus]AAB86061.1 ferripyochelin binding protein [Methanothermobacter thermautotrophicus str. Delta H]WBF06084.1 gamma carbonic anhydrase family protein [Methanothermobacter thermautotrophicus]WBF07873.1 gamma carbonic anhydrase family protein [Methanothermobacter thermautotrophicus]HOQ17886.1 gamma carbonic anhydrase family protein [Methanothermobacter thermautotrophicus]